MKYLVGLIMILPLAVNMNAQRLLFKNDAFVILKDRVKQGKFEAYAKSNQEIISSYKSEYKTPVKKNIEVKFCINGLDNERGFAQNHSLKINSVNGKAESPIIVFGEPDPPQTDSISDGVFLKEDVDYLVRLDMRKVLDEFNTQGFYTTFNGKKILKEDFKGVFIAGNAYPLSWDFESLENNPRLMLTDANNDGIYEITLHFKKEYSESDNLNEKSWKLSKDISQFPQLETPYTLIDALYNKTLEELLLDIREDGAFMAGAKWPGVWTRDISYSIYLSLAIIAPDACKTSLMAKVKNNRIIQDTGTGGSWPVSSDRMVWSLAAWEVYAVTGDKEWLKKCYDIIKNSSEDDLNTVRSNSNGLFHGESSFLDWREQSYPKWADPAIIYSSQCLGTNAVHFQSYAILAKMAKELNLPAEKYMVISEAIKDGINRYFWMNDKGYYGQYLLGKTFPSLSSKSEALGEAMTVLFDIADAEHQKEIIRKTPVVKYGIPVIFPNIPDLPSYHNNSIWPFVQAFWTLASAKAENAKSTEFSLASIYRAAALFLTNKENITASTGDYFGTEINSDRQLWSVAGLLSTIYRVQFGMNFESNGLSFTPFIPESYEGVRTLKNFKYRDAVLDISIDGFGSEVENMMLDGKWQLAAKIPADLKGKHTVVLLMKNKIESDEQINVVENTFAPQSPVLSLDKQTLKWNPVERAESYQIYKNGIKIAETAETFLVIEKTKEYTEYQVLAQDKYGSRSFLSEPLILNADLNCFIYQAEGKPKKSTLGKMGGILPINKNDKSEQLKENGDAADTSSEKKSYQSFLNDLLSSKARQEAFSDAKSKRISNYYQGYTGTGYVSINKEDKSDLSFEFDLKTSGYYKIDFRYANGNGPLTTDNKCAIRTVMLDKKALGPAVMPHKGEQSWSDWSFTNPLFVKLKRGKHTVSLTFRSSDNNMNGDINSAIIDYMRLTILK